MYALSHAAPRAWALRLSAIFDAWVSVVSLDAGCGVMFAFLATSWPATRSAWWSRIMSRPNDFTSGLVPLAAAIEPLVLSAMLASSRNAMMLASVIAGGAGVVVAVAGAAAELADAAAAAVS